MNSRIFIASLLALALPVSVQAQPTYKPVSPADFKVPEVDMQRWAERLKKLCPSDDWQVRVENNDVLILHYTTISTIKDTVHVKPGEEPKTLTLGFVYRVRLRFAPLLSMDKYEALEAENCSTLNEDTLLLKRYDVPARWEDFWVTHANPEFRERQKAYFVASKKLVFHVLPHFYTPDYSVTEYHTRSWFQGVKWYGTRNVKNEGQRLEAAIAAYFGKYSDLSGMNDVLFYLDPTESRISEPK